LNWPIQEFVISAYPYKGWGGRQATPPPLEKILRE